MKKWIIGIDEVGRGPLAGPVYVCAAMMKCSDYKKMKWREEGLVLTDSKKMSSKAREIWGKKGRALKQEGVFYFKIASQGATMIDRYGISYCIKKCIARVLKNLAINPKDVEVILDGGLNAPKEYRFQKTVIKGDQKHKIISLAAVLAKVQRDAVMDRFHKKYPEYGWDRNKGYGTREHRRAIQKRGTSMLHRKSFLTRLLTE